ncbi:hypothetical protein [Bradyrhizobium cajani]|uniref:Uncharacterized protein n=1 Tax=Bradyrhizobium cajani TaxID=1928661 RepID=A0A844TIJ9_9BRAD|nr:hypothetical protein [Bradyrhizobium cajani]MCP3370645.1 hypothetical protein [Bradyrhizobium cajani]MVT75202.1 hypothetical protein [Bradyrhizobium cajani]
MKLLMISGLAVLTVFVAATNMQRSHPVSASRTSEAGMLPVQEMQRQAQQSRLPADDFADRSLVFPRGTQQ